MPARGDWLGGFPAELLEPEAVVVEHGLALQHVKPESAEAAPRGDDHAVASPLWDLNVRRDRVRLVQNARCVSEVNPRVHTRVGKFRSAGCQTGPRRDSALELLIVERKHLVLGCL